MYCQGRRGAAEQGRSGAEYASIAKGVMGVEAKNGRKTRPWLYLTLRASGSIPDHFLSPLQL